MLTPVSVAMGRIKNNAAFQYRAWKMAIDWVVALYIVVPGLAVLGYQYIQWWQETPVWLEQVPYLVFRSYLFIAAVTGTIRYYVEDADQLFLIQREGWFRKMVATGATFSLVSHAVLMALIAVLLFPLLYNGYGVTAAETAFLFVATYLIKIYIMIGKQYLGMRLSGWKSVVVRGVLMAGLAALFGLLTSVTAQGNLAAIGIIVALLLPLVWLVPSRLRAKGTFYHDVRREREERMKLAGMLMSAGGYPARRKAKASRKHPLLFRASGKLFKQRTQENILAETLIKAILRSPAKLKLIGLLALACVTALFLCPSSVIRHIAFLLVSALFAWMVKAFAKEAATEAYVQLFPWNDTVRLSAFWKIGAAITVPACGLFGFVVGLRDGGILNAILMAPFGAALGWIVSRMFGMNGVQVKRS